MVRLCRVLFVLLLVASACGGSETATSSSGVGDTQAAERDEPTRAANPEPDPTVTPEPEPTEVATPPAPTSAPEQLRAESVQQVVDVVLALINGDRTLSEADYESFFAAPFRQQVPFAAFQGVNAQLGAQAPWTLVEPLEQAPAGAAS